MAALDHDSYAREGPNLSCQNRYDVQTTNVFEQRVKNGITLSYVLVENEFKILRSCYPDTILINGSKGGGMHRILKAHHSIAEVYARNMTAKEPIISVGPNPMRFVQDYKEGDLAIVPTTGERDVTRYIRADHQIKSMRTTKAPQDYARAKWIEFRTTKRDNEVFCGELAQKSQGVPCDRAIAMHSAYDMTLDDIAQFMVNRQVKWFTSFMLVPVEALEKAAYTNNAMGYSFETNFSKNPDDDRLQMNFVGDNSEGYNHLRRACLGPLTTCYHYSEKLGVTLAIMLDRNNGPAYQFSYFLVPGPGDSVRYVDTGLSHLIEVPNLLRMMGMRVIKKERHVPYLTVEKDKFNEVMLFCMTRPGLTLSAVVIYARTKLSRIVIGKSEASAKWESVADDAYAFNEVCFAAAVLGRTLSEFSGKLCLDLGEKYDLHKMVTIKTDSGRATTPLNVKDCHPLDYVRMNHYITAEAFHKEKNGFWNHLVAECVGHWRRWFGAVNPDLTGPPVEAQASNLPLGVLRKTNDEYDIMSGLAGHHNQDLMLRAVIRYHSSARVHKGRIRSVNTSTCKPEQVPDLMPFDVAELAPQQDPRPRYAVYRVVPLRGKEVVRELNFHRAPKYLHDRTDDQYELQRLLLIEVGYMYAENKVDYYYSDEEDDEHGPDWGLGEGEHLFDFPYDERDKTVVDGTVSATEEGYPCLRLARTVNVNSDRGRTIRLVVGVIMDCVVLGEEVDEFIYEPHYQSGRWEIKFSEPPELTRLKMATSCIPSAEWMSMRGDAYDGNRCEAKIKHFVELTGPLPGPVLDLCGAPGAFARYLEGEGIVCHTFSKGNSILYDEDIPRANEADVTTKNGKQQIYRHVRRNGKPYTILADGGFDCRDEGNQEQEWLELITSEIEIVRSCLPECGVAIIKFIGCNDVDTIRLLYGLKKSFRHTTLEKPPSSRATNSEFYAFCLGYIPHVEYWRWSRPRQIMEMLQDIEFYDFITLRREQLNNAQCEAIRRCLLNDPVYYNPPVKMEYAPDDASLSDQSTVYAESSSDGEDDFERLDEEPVKVVKEPGPCLVKVVHSCLTKCEDSQILHCVSNDHLMLSGAAGSMSKKWHSIKSCLSQVETVVGGIYPTPAGTNNVWNMVTKAVHNDKPDPLLLHNMIHEAFLMLSAEGHRVVHCTRLGAGLDRVEWGDTIKVIETASRECGVAVYIHDYDPKAEARKPEVTWTKEGLLVCPDDFDAVTCHIKQWLSIDCRINCGYMQITDGSRSADVYVRRYSRMTTKECKKSLGPQCPERVAGFRPGANHHIVKLGNRAPSRVRRVEAMLPGEWLTAEDICYVMDRQKEYSYDITSSVAIAKKGASTCSDFTFVNEHANHWYLVVNNYKWTKGRPVTYDSNGLRKGKNCVNRTCVNCYPGDCGVYCLMVAMSYCQRDNTPNGWNGTVTEEHSAMTRAGMFAAGGGLPNMDESQKVFIESLATDVEGIKDFNSKIKQVCGETPVVPECIRFITGVPGAGKTTQLFKKLRSEGKKIHYAAPTRALATEFEGRADKSFTHLHAVNQFPRAGTVLVIDEVFFLTAAAVCHMAANYREVYALGDPKQIGFIDYNSDYGERFDRNLTAAGLMTPANTTDMSLSYRCPQDIVNVLNKHHGYQMTTNSKVSKSIMEQPHLEAKHLVFTQNAKSRYPGSITVHEAQGHTFQHVTLHLTKVDAQLVKKSSEHIVVALTRHTKTIYVHDEESGLSHLILPPEIQAAIDFAEVGVYDSSLIQEDQFVEVAVKPSKPEITYKPDLYSVEDVLSKVSNTTSGVNGVVVSVVSRVVPDVEVGRLTLFPDSVADNVNTVNSGSSSARVRKFPDVQKRTRTQSNKLNAFNVYTLVDRYASYCNNIPDEKADELADEMFTAWQDSYDLVKLNDIRRHLTHHAAAAHKKFMRNKKDPDLIVPLRADNYNEWYSMDYMSKTQQKPALADAPETIPKAGQGVSCSKYADWYHLSSWMRAVDEALQECLKENVHTFQGKNEEAVILKLQAIQNKHGHLGTTVDIDHTQFDASQSSVTARFFGKLLLFMGCPESVAFRYVAKRMEWRMSMKHLGRPTANLDGTGKFFSGCASTLLQNTQWNIATSNMLLKAERWLAKYHKGDDFSARGIDIRYDDKWAKILGIKVKIQTGDSNSFVGYIINNWGVSVDFVRQAAKLSSKEFKTPAEFKSYQDSVADWIRPVHSANLHSMINACAHHYKLNEYSVETLFRFLQRFSLGDYKWGDMFEFDPVYVTYDIAPKTLKRFGGHNAAHKSSGGGVQSLIRYPFKHHDGRLVRDTGVYMM
nr:MAG: non-structural polyprotein [Avian associated hepe-like virus 20]